MVNHSLFLPKYSGSHALIIGIDKYRNVSPLNFASNDAHGLASILENLGFSKDNIQILIDEDATKAAILSAFLKYADSDRVDVNDRILLFYAGHGHTVPGHRGDIGFLIPFDGILSDLSTLIRWDELTRSAELINAKHILFLMDACYGGLALRRNSVPPGGSRLLNDMLQRFSRQVLTAGKGDETVSDGDGTRSGHSIFTSHLLDALEGGAAATGGVVTANGVMAYVYDKVGGDVKSMQTPHYGFLDGDGDFVFKPLISELLDPENRPSDLVQIPSFVEEERIPNMSESFSDKLKSLLSEPKDRIHLDDFVSSHLRFAVQELGIDKFPADKPFSQEDFVARLSKYEEIIENTETAVILLAKWASVEQIKLLERIFQRLSEIDKGQGGLVHWLRLNWYPVTRLQYAAGISAIYEGRYDTLKATLLTPVQSGQSSYDTTLAPVIKESGQALWEISDNFKNLPGFERRKTPKSDYLYQTLQAKLEDQLFIGSAYDRVFDEFEAYQALLIADMRKQEGSEFVSGPPGRFSWKQYSGSGKSTLSLLRSEATSEGDAWPPLRAGLFGGSAQRFLDASERYAELAARSGWA